MVHTLSVSLMAQENILGQMEILTKEILNKVQDQALVF